ncbi:unnamed protein product, partial [Pleuronectes platessa]
LDQTISELLDRSHRCLAGFRAGNMPVNTINAFLIQGTAYTLWQHKAGHCPAPEGPRAHYTSVRSDNALKISSGHGLTGSDSAVNHNTNQGGAGPHSIWGGRKSRDGLLLRQKLKMDNKSKKRPGGAEKHREKKPKSLEVEAAKCAKLTDLFGAGQQQVRRETSEEDSTMMSEWRQTC